MLDKFRFIIRMINNSHMWIQNLKMLKFSLDLYVLSDLTFMIINYSSIKCRRLIENDCITMDTCSHLF